MKAGTCILLHVRFGYLDAQRLAPACCFLLVLFLVSQVLGHDDTLTYEPWPEHDEALLVEDSIMLPVQVCYHLLFVLAKSCCTDFAQASNSSQRWHAWIG